MEITDTYVRVTNLNSQFLQKGYAIQEVVYNFHNPHSLMVLACDMARLIFSMCLATESTV